jgi:hypothetical protein
VGSSSRLRFIDPNILFRFIPFIAFMLTTSRRRAF